MKEIGTVISTPFSPCPTQVNFVVNEDSPVHKGQFVEMDYSEGTLIALVSNVIKTNKYFERADSVKEFESNGFALTEQFPTTEWEFLVAETRPLGVFNKGLTKRSTFPPSPGTKVRIASSENLKKFFSFDEKNGLMLGKVEYHDVDVQLNLTKLLQKHVAVLAQSGFGKCVSPGAKVLLSNGKEIEIGKLVDENLKNGFEIDGEMQYSKSNPQNLSVISLGSNNSLKESLIKAFSRRKAPREMYLIKTRTGKEIELTPEHSVPILNEWISWVPSSHLSEGNYLLLPKPSIEGFEQIIDFVELWKDSGKVKPNNEITLLIKKTINEKKIQQKELAKKLNVNYGTFQNWLNFSDIPLKHLEKICIILGLDFNELKKSIVFLRCKNKKIPAFIKIDKDFARLFGYWLAEGHNAIYNISFTNNSSVIRKDFSELVEKIFGEKMHIYEKENCLICFNRLLAESLKKIGFTESSWTKFVPSEIILSKEEVRFAFLSAFVDCDGHVSKDRPLIEICIASKKIVEAIQPILLFSGIISILKKKEVNGKYYQRLYFSGSKNLLEFKKRAELRVSHKAERLDYLAKLKSNPNIEVVPTIQPHIKRLLAILNLAQTKTNAAGITNYLGRKDNPSFFSLELLITSFENRLKEIEETIYSSKKLYLNLPRLSEKDALPILRQAYQNGFDFQEIAEGTNISSTTARRVISNITAPTNKVFVLAQNVLMLEKQQNSEIDVINTINLKETALQIKALCEKLGYELKDLCKDIGIYKQALYDYNTNRKPLYSTLLRFSEKLNQIALTKEIELVEAKDRIAFLKSLINSNLFFDQIVEIKKVSPAYEFVYDLCVENSNFTANNILIHNSYLISVLFEELLERKKEQGRIAVIVLDVHGEYSSFAEVPTDKVHKNFASKTKVIRAQTIKIGVSKLSASMLSIILPGLSVPGKRDLGRIISKLQKEMRSGLGPYDLNAIREELFSDDSIKENTKNVLLGWIAELDDLNLFDKIDSPSLEEIVKPGMLTVIDFSDMISLKKKQIIVNFLGYKLFSMRRQKEIPPFLLVLEEAHQFIPEKAPKEGAIARNIMQTIAREGRKFGASLCLISQRPIHLSTTVLSQCNSHIILRITNPYDLDHIGKSCEGLDRRALDMITSLRVGEALILGEATGFPLFFKVRERKSLESRHEKALDKAAIEFESANEKNKSETKAFL